MKFSGYYFYMNTNMKGDFQICISIPLTVLKLSQSKVAPYLKRCSFLNVFCGRLGNVLKN